MYLVQSEIVAQTFAEKHRQIISKGEVYSKYVY